MADYVEERTVELIEHNFRFGYQNRPDGTRMVRGMGDIWIESGGILNPINIKSGESTRRGQPNMVSLKKLLRCIVRSQIDSYYILIIKFDLERETTDVNLVDILDYLEFTHFDSGPGQIMLKEASFYSALDSGFIPPSLGIQEKASLLLEKLREADKRLYENRERARQELERQMEAFNPEQRLDQRALNIR